MISVSRQIYDANQSFHDVTVAVIFLSTEMGKSPTEETTQVVRSPEIQNSAVRTDGGTRERTSKCCMVHQEKYSPVDNRGYAELLQTRLLVIKTTVQVF